MLDDLQSSDAPARAFRLLVAGIGGAGCRAVRRLDPAQADLVLIHTDAQALAAPGPARALQLGSALLHGSGTGGDVNLGLQAAEADAAVLRRLFQGCELVLFVAGLGGGTGSGALPVLTRIAREASCLTLALVSTPFSFEGDQRRIHSDNALHQLRISADAVAEFPNDRLIPDGSAPVGLSRAFAAADAVFASMVPVLHGLIGRDSLLRLDFADLRRVFRHCGGTLHVAAFTLPAAGLRERFVHEVLASPLLERGQSLARARAVLAGLVAGPTFPLQDLEWVARELRAGVLGQPAQFKIGATVDESAGGDVRLLILTADRWSEKVQAVESLPGTISVSATEEPDAVAAPVAGDGAPVQTEIPLTPIDPNGQFVDTEPTQIGGEDLDVPTFLRRGIRLKAG